MFDEKIMKHSFVTTQTIEARREKERNDERFGKSGPRDHDAQKPYPAFGNRNIQK
jgi:hypothetical protein